MSNEKMRKEFQSWALDRKMSLERDGVVVDYSCRYTDLAWDAWQASRAALVIELPKRVGYEHRYDEISMSLMEPDQDPNADESFGLVREIEVLEAIEAAGLKVKP